MRLACAATLLLALLVGRQVRADDDIDFEKFSLEELTSLKITSASKRAQRLTETSAAAFVITADDIRRSGLTTIPELLRLAPGVHVARQRDSVWAVSIRGFEERFANKLLVLIDGRSVYTTAFGGVFWDVQTPPLDDIERIEVIRGPGATLWGANAVNGIVNIITRSARDSQGSRVLLRAGDEEQFTSELRHGFSFGEGGRARVSGAVRHRNAQADLRGHESFDDSRLGRFGSRIDWQRGPDELSLDLGWYSAETGYEAITFLPDYSNVDGTFEQFDQPAFGAIGGARWRRKLGDDRSFELSATFERANRHGLLAPSTDRTLDLAFENQLRFESGHQVV